MSGDQIEPVGLPGPLFTLSMRNGVPSGVSGPKSAILLSRKLRRCYVFRLMTGNVDMVGLDNVMVAWILHAMLIPRRSKADLQWRA